MPLPILDRAFSLDMWDFARVSQERDSADYRHRTDFQDLNPQYVILHEEEASKDPNLCNRWDVKKALREINLIKLSCERGIEIYRPMSDQKIQFRLKTKQTLICDIFGVWEVTTPLRCIEIDRCAPEEAIPYINKKRPTLVCGFFGEWEVRDLTENLKRRGYNAHISLEGTCKYI
jgi:hypothetical protein